jgi:hypothetical protein
MMQTDLPAPMFRRFERVAIADGGLHHKEYEGERGTVIWLDSYSLRRRHPKSPEHRQWVYVVHLPTRNCCPTLFETGLRSEGAFDSEPTQLGVRPEISFDIVPEDDNDFIEGSYRVPGQFWQVVVCKKADVSEVRHRPAIWRKTTEWEGEITGVIFQFPRAAGLNRASLLRAMSDATGFSDWSEVNGPDSMVLR